MKNEKTSFDKVNIYEKIFSGLQISTWKTLFEFPINNWPLRVKYLLNFNSLLLSKNSSGELRNWAWSSAKVGVAKA